MTDLDTQKVLDLFDDELNHLVDFFLKDEKAQNKAVDWLAEFKVPRPIGNVLVKCLAAKLVDFAGEKAVGAVSGILRWGWRKFANVLPPDESETPKVARFLLARLGKLTAKHRAEEEFAGWIQVNIERPASFAIARWNDLENEDEKAQVFVIDRLNQLAGVPGRLAAIEQAVRLRPKLTLRDEFRRPAFADSPSGRLNPFNRRIPLIGRDEELAGLREWLGNEKNSVSFRCIIGPAGTGKTRLALEFCEEAISAGWRAGFLEEDEQEAFRDRLAEAAWAPDEPTLIVVDYAASKADSLSRLLDSLAGGEQAETLPVRVLLLERYGEERQGWWLNLLGGYSGTRGPLIQAHFDPSEPVPLSALESPADQRAVLQAIFDGFENGLHAPSLEDEKFYSDINHLTQGGEPLLLQMAAEAAQDYAISDLATLRREDLLEVAVTRERSRLDRAAKAHDMPNGRLLERMAVLATLCQGLGRDQVFQMIDAEVLDIGLKPPAPVSVYEGLQKSFGQPGVAIPPLTPDLLGEWLIYTHLKELGDAGDSRAISLLKRVFEIDPDSFIRTLIRLTQDFHDEDERPQPLLWLSHVVDPNAEEPHIASLREVESLLPERTQALRQYAHDVTARLLESLRPLKKRVKVIEESEIGLASESSRLLNNLSFRLSELGRREDALNAIEEAVEIRRKLAAQRPDAFNPVLASSLNNLSAYLSELGRREDAIEAIEEAVEIRRKLAAQSPDAFNPNLSNSLSNLSVLLSKLGRREDAIEAIEEAVDLYRKLAAERPDAFNPDLAMSLNNLSNRLSKLGRREDAIEAIEGAVEIYRKLAAQSPDAFNPDLATSLNNFSVFLSELGRREDALEASEETVDLYRKLAAERPDAFNPDLASSINNLSGDLSKLGRREDALEASEEAVEIRRKLAAQSPDAFNPVLASSLNNLSLHLSDLGRREDALKAIEEAVDLYRKLAAQRPDTFNPDLASSLNNLSKSLSELGRREDALKAGEEAVEFYRKLAAQRPNAFNPDLAMSLNNLSSNLSELGRREDALEAIEEAVEIRRNLAAQRPDAFNPDLAMSLGAMHQVLVGMGREKEAYGIVRGGVEILRPMFLEIPPAFAKLMGMLVRDYVQLAESLSEKPDAELLGPIEEALERLKKEKEE